MICHLRAFVSRRYSTHRFKSAAIKSQINSRAHVLMIKQKRNDLQNSSVLIIQMKAF